MSCATHTTHKYVNGLSHLVRVLQVVIIDLLDGLEVDYTLQLGFMLIWEEEKEEKERDGEVA